MNRRGFLRLLGATALTPVVAQLPMFEPRPELLSASSLETLLISIRKHVDDSAERLTIVPTRIIVTPEQMTRYALRQQTLSILKELRETQNALNDAYKSALNTSVTAMIEAAEAGNSDGVLLMSASHPRQPGWELPDSWFEDEPA